MVDRRISTFTHVVLLLILACLTWICHSVVNHKFTRMMDGLQLAASYKRDEQMEGLAFIDSYHSSEILHHEYHQQLHEAYMKQREAAILAAEIKHETADISAAATAKNGTSAEKKALDLEYQSALDQIQVDNHVRAGEALKDKAMQEESEAKEHLENADALEAEGTTKLEEAQAQLDALASGSPPPQETHPSGICRWFQWACNHDNKDLSNKPTAASIQAAREVDEALGLISQARKEKDTALALLRQSSLHANMSLTVLEEVPTFQKKADEEHSEAESLEQQGGDPEADKVKVQDNKFEALMEERNTLLDNARKEADKAKELDDVTLPKERKRIEETELVYRSATFEARKHITHGGWYALCAIILALGLFVLSATRFLDVCINEDPLRWIIEDSPHALRDASYLLNHVFIFVMLLAFSGQLLHTFHLQRFGDKLKTTILFAVVGALSQATVLHFAPNLVRLCQRSGFTQREMIVLVQEHICKDGLILFLVFVNEFLICWVVLGSFIFSHAYLLNRMWLWLLVGFSCFAHVASIEIVPSRGNTMTSNNISVGSDVENYSSTESHNESTSTELQPLVASSKSKGSDQSNLSSVDLRSPPSSSQSDYGGTNRDEWHVASVMSMSSRLDQLVRVVLLLDALATCWATWVIGRDISMLFRLSPLSAGIVWGLMPLWVLVFFVSLIALIGVTISTWYIQRDDV